MEISDKIIFSNPVRRARLICVVMFIACFALAVGLAISHFEPFEEKYSLVVATIFFTLGVSFLVNLSIVFWEKPREYREIPREFYDEAMEQFKRTQFYRTECKVKFVVKNSKFSFSLYSTLNPMLQGVTIPYPSGKVPKESNLERISNPRYYCDEIEQSIDKPIEIGKKERLEIDYKIICEKGDIEDTHNWKSPVHGFELTADLPSGYKMEVIVLSSSSSGYGETPIYNLSRKMDEWLFKYNKPLFPHQGFRWKITQLSNSR